MTYSPLSHLYVRFSLSPSARLHSPVLKPSLKTSTASAVTSRVGVALGRSTGLDRGAMLGGGVGVLVFAFAAMVETATGATRVGVGVVSGINMKAPMHNAGSPTQSVSAMAT